MYFPEHHYVFQNESFPLFKKIFFSLLEDIFSLFLVREEGVGGRERERKREREREREREGNRCEREISISFLLHMP